MWLLTACVTAEPPEPLPVFEPAGVGFGFDGIVLGDGTLTDYFLSGASYDPVMFQVFASEDFLAGDASSDETCVSFGAFAPAPSEFPLATEGDAAVFTSWEGALAIDRTTCVGRVDEEAWGLAGNKLWAGLDGARVGFAIGPQLESLAAEWDQADLDAVGDSMLAGWFAFEDPATTTAGEPSFVAFPWTTVVAYEVDPVTLDPLLTITEEGNYALVPLDVTGWAPGDELPPFYARSTPVVYQDLLPIVATAP
jgi:hypothetical protein